MRQRIESDVAVQDLLKEESQRDDRRQEPFAPRHSDFSAELGELLIGAEFLGALGLELSQHAAKIR